MPLIAHHRPEYVPGTPCKLGIDEAGRGAFLGAMVYGCAYWPIEEDAACIAMGFDDSKALTEARREVLFERMCTPGSRVGWVTHSISAAEISAAMLHRSPISLNVLSHDAAADMLELVLASGIRVEEVFVDTVGDPDFYAKKLDSIFNLGSGGGGGAAGRGWSIAIVVSKKADSLYKTVSAGSIAAKVTRDRALRDWVFEEPEFAGIVAGAAAGDAAATAHNGGGGGEGRGEGGETPKSIDSDEECENAGGAGDGGSGGGSGTAAKRARFEPSSSGGGVGVTVVSMHPASAGSGYPSDPLTKAWLANFLDPVFGWPSVARFSWAPAKSALEKDGTRVVWPDEETVAAVAGGQAQLSSFFASSTVSRGGPAASTAAAGPRAKWFRQRFLTPVLKI